MIIILGAGITGLAAAFELTRRGVPFVLLDPADRTGGLVQTEHAGGFTIDAGPDSLLVQKPAAIDLCHELGLGPRLLRMRQPRTAFVLARGRLHPLPARSVLGVPTTARALARYRLLPPRARLRVAFEPVIPRGTAADESVGAFFRRRFGAQTVGLIAEPLLGGIHAGDIEELSIASLFPRLKEAEQKRGKVLRTLARSAPPPADGLFRALHSGMRELVDALETRLAPGAIRLKTMPLSLLRQPEGWRVGTPDGPVDGKAVILTLPARAAARLLAPLDTHAADLCAAVRYVSTASVALGFRRDQVGHPLAGSGFVVARRYSRTRITACTWVSSKWEHRAPEGHVLLRAFLGGSHDPDVVSRTDEELVDTALRDLTPILGIAGPPVLTRAFRSIDAGAQHVVGHKARLRELSERLTRLGGLFAAGSGFDSIGIPDCVANGRRAAAEAADYSRSALR